MKRREFLRKGIQVGLAANALPLLVGGMPLQVFGKGGNGQKALADNGQVLVMLQLSGGNDGLNCLVPYYNPTYTSLRPDLRLNKPEFKLNFLPDHGSLAMHQDLPEVFNLYKTGRMTILQNVGYPNPEFSHFRGTDIVHTATDSNLYRQTGWVGRLLTEQNPAFSMSTVTKGSDPLAIHFGTVPINIFHGRNGEMGIPVAQLPDPVMNSVHTYDPIGSNPDLAHQSLSYVRDIQQETEVYNSTLANRAVTKNKVIYPDTLLGQQLASVAQLIASGLKTRIYVVTQGGYDFHSELWSGQSAHHIDLDAALWAFQNDLEALKIADKVITMTYSEFGRRPVQNGSGTDHGASYPLFVVGTRVKGGILGHDPDLDNLIYDNLNYDQRHDFRNVYATMMSEWLGVDDKTISNVLTASNSETYSTNANWIKLGLFKPSQGLDPIAAGSQFGLMLMQNHPNPVITSTTIEFALPASTNMTLGVFNGAGQEVARLVDGLLHEGNHRVEFRPSGLASGRYFYRLITPQDKLTRQMMILH